jgi:hypothetical protein
MGFTGGEPTLAPFFVSEVSRRAAEWGVKCGIVTSAFWARDDRKNRAFVSQYPGIEQWDISTDLYHLPFVPLARVQAAYLSLKSLGKTTKIRLAYHKPLHYEEAVLIDHVRHFAEQDLQFQAISPIGRAKDLVDFPSCSAEKMDRSGCPSSCLSILANGKAAPCCGPLAMEVFDHPLIIGRIQDASLEELLLRWRTHPILQTLRLWGVSPFISWLREAGVNFHWHLANRVCFQCIALMQDARSLEIISQRSSTIEHQIKLALALHHYFDEPWLAEKLNAQYAHCPDSLSTLA